MHCEISLLIENKNSCLRLGGIVKNSHRGGAPETKLYFLLALDIFITISIPQKHRDTNENHAWLCEEVFFRI